MERIVHRDMNVALRPGFGPDFSATPDYPAFRNICVIEKTISRLWA